MADQENIPVTPAPLDDDTRTRKTMRLRTLIPAATGPQLASPEQSDAAVPAPAAPAVASVPAGVDEDTRTRMTVKLKPAVPAGAELNDDRTVRIQRPAPAAAPAVAAGVSAGW